MRKQYLDDEVRATIYNYDTAIMCKEFVLLSNYYDEHIGKARVAVAKISLLYDGLLADQIVLYIAGFLRYDLFIYKYDITS